MTSFPNWLRQPDDTDIVPVRGVVMRVAADQIERLQREVDRLKAEAGDSGSKEETITFLDGETERQLVWDGERYRIPEGAETIDDVRGADALPAPQEEAEKAEEAPAADAGEEEAAEEQPPAEEAPAEGNGGAEDEEDDDDDFELPPEWQ